MVKGFAVVGPYLLSLLRFISIKFIRKRKQPAVMFVVNKRIFDTGFVEIHDGKGHAFQK